jgi:hypothetical protein
MSALPFVAIADNIAITSGATVIVLSGTAPANHRLKLTGWTMTLGGVAALDITARLLIVTGTLTGTTVTPQKRPNLGSETLLSAWLNTVSGATASEVISKKRLQASFAEAFPLGQEIIVPGGGKFAVEITSTGSAATVCVEVMGEE